MLLDFHIHSIFSDGTDTVEKIFKRVKDKDLNFFSITDHDSLDSQRYVFERKDTFSSYGINYITGLEISTDYKINLDILGYGCDIYNENLNSKLDEVLDFRSRRNEMMVELFNKNGIEISMEELKDIAGNDIVGRPHFARLLLNKGYVKTQNEAFEKFIGDGKKFNIDKKKLSVKESIELIRNSGGIPSLAHPVYLYDDPDFESQLKKMVSYGLMGMEVYYSQNSMKHTDYFERTAKKYDLLFTAGSDYHGKNKNIDIGQINYNYNNLEKTIDFFKGKFII